MLIAVHPLFLPENNIARATGKIAQIRQEFRDAYAAIFQYPFDLAHENVLGTIIGVSAKVIVTRSALKHDNLIVHFIDR